MKRRNPEPARTPALKDRTTNRRGFIAGAAGVAGLFALGAAAQGETPPLVRPPGSAEERMKALAQFAETTGLNRAEMAGTALSFLFNPTIYTLITDISVSGILIPYHLHMFIVSGSRPFPKTHMPYLFHRFQNSRIPRHCFQYFQILLCLYIEQSNPLVDSSPGQHFVQFQNM